MYPHLSGRKWTHGYRSYENAILINRPAQIAKILNDVFLSEARKDLIHIYDLLKLLYHDRQDLSTAEFNKLQVIYQQIENRPGLYKTTINLDVLRLPPQSFDPRFSPLEADEALDGRGSMRD